MDIDDELFHLLFLGVIFWQGNSASAFGEILHADNSDHQFSGHCERRSFGGADGIAGVFSDADVG